MNAVFNSNTYIFRRALIQLYKKLIGKHNKLSIIRKEQWESLWYIKKVQEKRLLSLLSYSYKYVPYYKDVLKRANMINKNGNIVLSNYKNIPILDRKTIRNNFDKLQSLKIKNRRWKYKTTGGSTGEPLKVIQDLERVEWTNAAKELRNDWVKFKPGYPKATFSGIEIELFSRKEALFFFIKKWMENNIYLNAFNMTSEMMREYAHRINKSCPLHIKGYTNAIYQFAIFLKKEKIKIYSPHSIICSAGTLTDTMRKTIEDVFNSDVFNSYGSREIQTMAFECPTHSGLHVMAPLVYFEILNKDGNDTMPGEIGEVVLTPFFNYAMPLIRYRIGDMASWSREQCLCGRNWPLIEDIKGRTVECFIREDGGIVSPELFVRVMSNEEWINKYQIIQDEIKNITILIVASEQYIDPSKKYRKNIDSISKRICSAISNDCEINYKFVNDIPKTKSGKFLTTICNITTLT